MTEAKGFWKGQALWWNIEGEEVSDKDLRSFIFHNNDGYAKYVECVLEKHVAQYANRERGIK